MDKRTDEKKKRVLAALDKGMAMIHLDARRPGVLVPANLRAEPHLLLNLSYRFDPPDLTVGEWGIRSTLTFSGSRFTVAVPWSALYAITSHMTKEFWMYPDDMPPELLAAAQLTSKVPMDAVAPKPLELLREAVSEPSPAADEPAEEKPPTPRGRGHLRVVK